MEKIEKGHPLSQSTDIVSENIEMLKTLFPTIVKEGKIDIEELQALLGNEVETGEEYYRFTWAGKSMSRREANKPSTATLRPDKESSKDWDTTKNIFIEGDNLEVLKLLQKSYAGKIKMMYFDPPYNTGNDFVYKDNYTDNLRSYLELTGQSDEEGKKLNTNSESDGRFHSNWLNMMYPRLKLIRNLLTDDGAVFISIDDNEVQNLRKLCDEIFGEENFISIFPWQARQSIQNDTDISSSHEYVVAYAKYRRQTNRRLKESNAATWYTEKSFAFYPLPLNKEKFSNPDDDPRGIWKADPFDAPNIRPNLTYAIKNPKTNIEIWPPKGRCWRTSETEYLKLFEDNRIVFGKTGDSRPQLKVFYEEKKEFGSTPNTWLDGNTCGTATKGTKQLQDLFDYPPFDTPKPIELIMQLLLITTKDDDIILDIFAGSGSTAQAVMQQNVIDKHERKFICVQIPEKIVSINEGNRNFNNVSEICKERIRRAGEKIKSEQTQDLFTEQGKSLDVGFKAFKLDSSNIRAWDGSPEELEDNLLNAGNNIKEFRSEEDVLYEILLKYGLDLTMPIEQKEFAGKTVFNLGSGTLFICLADDITTAVAECIGKWKNELQPATSKVIFKDNGLTDVEKTNSMQILKRFEINEVNTI